jgi:hypothetical protein
MGRHRWSHKKTVEQCKCLDIFLLRRQGCLRGFTKAEIYWKNRSGKITDSMGIDISVQQENNVRLYYSCVNTTTGDKENFDYKIRLVTTPCYFGGKRFWFICPLIINGIPCDRMVGKLYLPSNAKYFGCRHCYNLTYKSCKEHDKRLDWIRKLPYTSFKRIMESGNPKMVLLGIKATLKNL